MSPSHAARLRSGREALADLERYRSDLTLERFLAGRDDQRKVLHALIIATQSCIDEALAACRERGLAGETYRGAFHALGEAGAFPPEWLVPLMDWASFRNVLAHFYPVIDLQRVWQALDHLAVLRRFLDWREAPRAT